MLLLIYRMSKDQQIQLNGIIEEALPNAMFKVLLQNGHIVLGILSGKMRIHHIKLTIGDKVLIEFSPYDLTKGRITRRLDHNPN